MNRKPNPYRLLKKLLKTKSSRRHHSFFYYLLALLLLVFISSLFDSDSEPLLNSPTVSPSPTPEKNRENSASASIVSNITYCYDGDTVVINGIKYRLYGIDAPERKQDFGQEAKNLTTKLYKKASIKRMGKDTYGRTLAIFSLHDGTTIQEQLITQGLAIVYDSFCSLDICSTWKKKEQIAKQQKIGMWKSPNPLSPKDFRNLQKKKSIN